MTTLNNQWLDKGFVDLVVASGAAIHCGVSIDRTPQSKMAGFCAKSLQVGEDGLLCCPVHGMKYLESMGSWQILPDA